MEGTPSESVPAISVVLMRLSTEAIVAAAVAVVFAVLTLGAIVRERGAPGNRLGNMPNLNQVARLGFDSPSSGPLLDGPDKGRLLAQY